jgi:hypothetical protein
MIEKEYKLSRTNEKAIEKVIFDEKFITSTWCLIKTRDCRALSNSNVYMTVIRGSFIGLMNRKSMNTRPGTLLKIPFPTKMNVINTHDETCELIVVRRPPRKLREDIHMAQYWKIKKHHLL